MLGQRGRRGRCTKDGERHGQGLAPYGYDAASDHAPKMPHILRADRFFGQVSHATETGYPQAFGQTAVRRVFRFSLPETLPTPKTGDRVQSGRRMIE